MQARNNRLRHGLSHVPSLLRFTISTATFLLIVLSFFVAVANPILDYVFTLSIGLLAFLIAMVIEDLDHPYRPGNWHLNKNIYKKLLAEMN
jgi:hypothetical protein